jgi:hypothetical protein
MTQGFIDLSGGPSQQLFPRHNARLTRQTTQSKARITAMKNVTDELFGHTPFGEGKR